jgi:hypothetical protein
MKFFVSVGYRGKAGGERRRSGHWKARIGREDYVDEPTIRICNVQEEKTENDIIESWIF